MQYSRLLTGTPLDIYKSEAFSPKTSLTPTSSDLELGYTTSLEIIEVRFIEVRYVLPCVKILTER